MTYTYEEEFKKLLKSTGEDPERPGLRNTPQRVLMAFQELTQGYSEDLDGLIRPALLPVENFGQKEGTSVITLKNIEFYSLCEHYLLPFFGICSIEIIPNEYLLGLSKIKTIVDHFSKRLQIQERLTAEIARSLEYYLKPKGIKIVMEAQHLCMMMRGMEKSQASLKTSVCLGDILIKN